MGSRALGAFLALAAAAAFVVSIATSTWWAGNPVVDGKVIEAKYVSVGPLLAQGCNIGGDGSCEPIQLDQTAQLLSYGELGAAALATLMVLVLMGAAWRVSDRRKGLSTASLLCTLLAAGGAGAMLALGPGIAASQQVEVPIGWGMFVFGGGVFASLLASAVTRGLRTEPLRLKPSLQQIPVQHVHQTPQPQPYAQMQAPQLQAHSYAQPAPQRQTPMPASAATDGHAFGAPVLPTPLPIASPLSPPAAEPSQARSKPPSTPPQRMSPAPPELLPRTKSPSAAPGMPGMPPPRTSPPAQDVLPRTKSPSAPNMPGLPPPRLSPPPQDALPRTKSPSTPPSVGPSRTTSPSASEPPRTKSPSASDSQRMKAPGPGDSQRMKAPGPGDSQRMKAPGPGDSQRMKAPGPGDPERMKGPGSADPLRPKLPGTAEPQRSKLPSVPPSANNAKRPLVPAPAPLPRVKAVPVVEPHAPHQRLSTEPGTPPPPDSSHVSQVRGSRPSITPPARSGTLAHAVPPMPITDSQPALKRAETDDDALRETEHITAVEIDVEAKAAAQGMPRSKGVPRADTDIRTGKNRVREPTDTGESALTEERDVQRPGDDDGHAMTELMGAQSVPEPLSVPDPTAQTLLAPEPPPPLTRIPAEDLMKTIEQNAGPDRSKLTPIPTVEAERAAQKLPISTAPTTLPPPKQLEVQPSGPTPACPQCESPMAWVEEHLRFYCKSCRMYF